MGGGAENDGYNALVLAAGMMWRDVALIRTISRFLRQIRVPYSQDYMWTTLVKHAAIAAEIVRLFQTRFDPRPNQSPDERKAREAEVVAAIEAALRQVESLDEDRILRRFVNAVQAALRTNFYQIDADGLPKHLIALKFGSRALESVPAPRPLYEIFVYSPRVEGVHLRFGKVARGGIRWSDRPQDFRTEILGLVKAQQVKNAVIVPVGAKGGFVPKQLAKGGTRETVQAEGTAAYKLFISTLLDITDNLGPQGVIPPANVLRHDDDDPYLVVAADKGTATFSDIANAIAQEHRLLARRRIRLRRFGRVRPQEDGHHRPRRLGIGQAPLPRDRHRHRRDAVHRCRHRRHVGRRVRQRHVAGKDDQARRRFRSSRHLHRPRPRSRQKLRRAPASVRSAALELAGLRSDAHLQGRRRVPARAEGDRALGGGARGAGFEDGQGDACRR